MAKPQPVVGKVVRDCLSNNPELPTKTIARILRTDNPELFKSIEAARSAVRYYRGNIGEKNRTKVGDREHLRPSGHQSDGLKIPQGIRQNKPPLVIEGAGKWLVMSDIHVPYHDERALEVALRTAVDEGCGSLYLNGDTIDFYSISRWQTDPRERNLKRECDTTKTVLEEIGKHFDRKVYKAGNHDERWEIFLCNRAEELVDFAEFSLPEVLKLNDYGYEFVHSKQWAHLGKLSLLHGHEFVRGLTSPVNPARGLWLKLSSTALAGHLHQTSHHSDTHVMTKEMVSCWSLGCLCDLHPAYAPLNKWNLGFGVVEVGHSGDFNVSNYKIDSNTYKVYRA